MTARGDVSCVVRSNIPSIAHFPRGHSIFRGPRFRKKPAGAGSELVINGRRCMHRARFRDVAFEFYEIGMSEAIRTLPNST